MVTSMLPLAQASRSALSSGSSSPVMSQFSKRAARPFCDSAFALSESAWARGTSSPARAARRSLMSASSFFSSASVTPSFTEKSASISL